MLSYQELQMAESEHAKLEEKFVGDLRNARNYRYLLSRVLEITRNTEQQSGDKEGPINSARIDVSKQAKENGRYTLDTMSLREKELLFTKLLQMFEGQLEVEY